MTKVWFEVVFRAWDTPTKYREMSGSILAESEEDAKQKVLKEGYQFISAKRKS